MDKTNLGSDGGIWSCRIELLESRIAPASVAFTAGLGNAQNENIEGVAVDHSGNIYVVGTFQGTVDFDPSSTGKATVAADPGRVDGFVAKYTGTGALSWVDVIRPSNEDTHGLHLAVTQSGDVFVTSNFGQGPNEAAATVVSFFQGSSQTESTSVSQLGVGSPTDIYVTKLDTTGAFVWAQVYGSINSAGLGTDDIAVDNNGSVYVAGSFDAGPGPGSVTFGGTPPLSGSGGDENLYVIKLQDGASPTVVWASQTTSSGNGNNHIMDAGIAVDGAGNAFIAGDFNGALTFNATTVTAPLTGNAQENFFAKLDNAGNWSWAGQMNGPSGTDSSNYIAVDTTGNVYVTGEFGGTADFDPGAGTQNRVSAGSADGFLLKLDPSGAFLSVKQFGSKGNDSVGPVALDANNNIYLAGNFSGTVDFGGAAGMHTLTSAANGGIYILTLDSSENFVSVAGLAASGSNSGSGFNGHDGQGGGGGMTVDGAGGIYFAGTFRGTFDLGMGSPGHTLTSHGGLDFFIARYLPANVVAQTLEPAAFQLGFSVGSTGSEDGSQIVTDAAGDIYVAGVFSGTVDFDPGPGVTNLTSTDPDGNIFVAKYAPGGALIWARSVQESITRDGHASEPGVELGLDNAGNVYLSGEYDAKATFSPAVGADIVVINSDPTPPVGTSSRDVFITKLDGNGIFQWAGTIGNAGGNDFVHALTVNAATGSLDIAGTFANTVDFDPGAGVVNRTAINGNGMGDSFILQLDTTGAFSWVRQLGGAASYLNVRGLALDSTGDVIATGGFIGMPDFNYPEGPPDTLSGDPTLNHIFVAKFSGGTGLIAWKDAFGVQDSSGAGVIADSQNNIFVTGRFSGAADFDPGPGTSLLVSSGGDNAFLLKLDDNGVFTKVVGFGGAGNDIGGRVSIDGTGAVYVAGGSSGTVDLDPGPGYAPLSGQFLSRFSSNLDFLSAFSFSGGQDVYVDAQGDGFVTGGFTGTMDFDPGKTSAKLTSNGGKDIFVVQLGLQNVVDANNPVITVGETTVGLTGAGDVILTIVPDPTTGGTRISAVELQNTHANSTLTISGPKTGTTTLDKIMSMDPSDSVGSIKLGANVILGDGVNDSVPDVDLEGSVKSLKLGDINSYTSLSLGKGLPYLATYKNHPNVALHDVMGPGVVIDATSDGMIPGATGGGGLGKVVVNQWSQPGMIETSQGVSSFQVKSGDCFVTLELDPNHLGANTIANIGKMLIPNGAWGSSGSVIEGSVGTFSAASFLASADITAASMGKLLVKNGSYAGTTTLTDPTGKKLGTFSVNGDYLGFVNASAGLGNINIKGDFKGSLSAQFIGSISAYSFDGTGMSPGDRDQIVTTGGSLGTIKTSARGIQNFIIDAATVFDGFAIKWPGAPSGAVGIDNVTVAAGQINHVDVTLTGSGTHIGIETSVFESASSIGEVTSSSTVTDTLFAATTNLGNVVVKGDLTSSKLLAGTSLGGDGVLGGGNDQFTPGGSVGNVTVSGMFATTTIAAGVDPGMDLIYGNGDTVGTSALVTGTSKIGALIFGAASGTVGMSSGAAHSDAIEAAAIKSLKVGTLAAIKSFATAQFLDTADNGEDAADVLVTVI